MKTKLLRIFGVFLLLVSQIVLAQEKSISGTVIDNNGLPLPGVNILVQNTTKGTQSDFDGKYTIDASVGQTLVFSFVGFKTQEIPVQASTNTLNITLEEDAAALDEVVVTALGIKKEKKALGYAVTALKSEDIEQRATGDITKILRGKAAGVNIINASGLSGTGSSVTIRGLTSTGNNQPLYVVDGVRFNSNTNGTGFSGTSRSLDLDPNNISSVNVLKGLSATALYGADGKNGVIVITTKAGQTADFVKRKTEVSVTASTFVNEIASLPDYTDQRGQGYYDAFYNFFGNWGATFGRTDYGNVDPNGQVPHPYGLNSTVFQNAFPEQVGSKVDYKNYKSQENFFRTGVVSNLNANINGGNEKASYNLFIGNLEDEGFLPGNKLRRHTISLGGNAKLTNKLTVSSTLNYSGTDFTSPFTGDIFDALNQLPRSIDLAGFPFEDPVSGQEISFQNTVSNPYWVVKNTGVEEDVTRVYGQISASYPLTDWLSASYRYGLDIAVEQRRVYENKGNVGGDLGQLTTNTRRQQLTNHSFLLNIDKRFVDEKFGLSANVGADITRTQEYYEITQSSNQTVYNNLEHQFFSERDAASGRYVQNRPGILGQVTLDYNKWLYLSGSARNDWTSSFIDNSQFYPGVGISVIPTEVIEGLKGDALNYFKIRANYGSSADFNVPGSSLFGLFNPYPTFQTVTTDNAFVNANGETITVNTTDDILANRAIKPALIEEYEFGIESKFWKNRISLDASYFKRVTSDLIFSRQLDPSTGFTDSPQNVNEFEVNGVEVEMNITLLQSDDFSFDIGGNFTANESEVTELEEDRFAVAVIGTPTGTVGNYLVKGEPVNVILGSVIATNDDGEYLLDGRDYIIAEDIEIIGDPNPDWIASMFTALRYKNFSLTGNIQYRKGGDIYSGTTRDLLGRGLTSDTDGINNVGFVLPGVLQDTGETNDVVISSGDAYFNIYNNGGDEIGIFDGTTIRLQELALSYSFTPKSLEKTPFGSLSITLTGENLYYNAINVPDGINLDTNAIATDVNSNGAGIEDGISPTSRRYGFSVKASF